MGKGNINKTRVLNPRQVIISIHHFYAHAHTNTYKLSTESPFWYSIPTRYCCFFSPDSRFFCLRDGFEIQSLIWKTPFGKEDKNRSEGARQPPLTGHTSWLGAALQTSPADHSKARTSKPA